jgi:hypothetical protein
MSRERNVKKTKPGFGKRGSGFGSVILLGQCGTEVVMEVSTFRGQLDGAAKFGSGLFQVLVAQCPAQHAVGFGIFWFGLDGGAELLFRFWSFVLLGENTGERDSSAGASWAELDGGS